MIIEIGFSGGEGSGKTTITNQLSEYYKNVRNYHTIVVNNPGFSKTGKDIRKVIMDNNDINKEAETYLFMAALDDSRDKALKQMVIPEDEVGIIFYDRTILDTYVYQTLTQKSKVNPFNENIFKLPDIQFILDLEPEIGFERIKLNQRETNRFDEKSLNYHKEIHANFLKSYEEMHNKIDSYMFIINASKSINDILNSICETIDYTYFRENYYDYRNNQRYPFWSDRS